MQHTLLSEMTAVRPNKDLIKKIIQSSDKNCLDERNKQYETPIHAAVERGWLDIVKLLVECGATVDNMGYMRGESPLHLAVWLNAYEIAKYLLSVGADVNKRRLFSIRGKNHVSPLATAAAFQGHPLNGLRMVELLITNGADVNMRFWRDETAMHIAAEYHNDNIIWMLAKAGADVNATDENGETPLHSAATSGGYWTCKTLIELGADINAKSTNLYAATPLYNVLRSAVMDKKAEAIETARGLIELGADPDIPCYRKVTPRKLAERLGFDL